MFLPEGTWHLITFHDFTHIAWMKAEYPPQIPPRLFHEIINGKPVLAFIQSQAAVVLDGICGPLTHDYVASYTPQPFFTFSSDGLNGTSFCKDPMGNLLVYKGHNLLYQATDAERLALKAYL